MKVQKISKSFLQKLNSRGVVEFNKDLLRLNTFRISAKSRIYLEINTIENLIDTVDYLHKLNISIFILGGGSNVLVDNYSGAVIKLGGDFCHIEEIDDIIEMSSAVQLSKVYKFTLEHSLGGFEESVGIPGTIGGAVYMNASCYGFEMSRLVEYVVAYNIDTGKITYFSQDNCLFGYRDSVFKCNKYIILRVGLKLQHLDSNIISQICKDTLNKRNSSQPKGFSAGCVFKRIDGLNISKMLDDMGIKGKSVNDAIVSDKHANFIMNKGNATSADIKKLIEEIKAEFKKTYNIDLQTEIKYL